MSDHSKNSATDIVSIETNRSYMLTTVGAHVSVNWIAAKCKTATTWLRFYQLCHYSGIALATYNRYRALFIS